MTRLQAFIFKHKTLFLSLSFLVAFSVGVSYAAPLVSPYTPGQTLDPQCAPGDTNCSVTNTPAAGSTDYIQNTTSPQTANFNITGNGIVGGILSVGGSYNLYPVNGESGIPPVMDVVIDESTNTEQGPQFTDYGNNGGHANMHFRKARGTPSAPSAILAGDYLYSFGARGYGTTGFNESSGALQFLAAENFSDTNAGTYGQIQTTSIGRNVNTQGRDHTFKFGSDGVFTAERLNLGTTSTVSPRLYGAGALSSSAWGSSGIDLSLPQATYTDTTSSGTVSNNLVNVFGQPTLVATNPTTYTTATNVYIGGAPVAGTNVTLTNDYALWVAGGLARFSGGITAGGSQSLPQWNTSGPLLNVFATTLTNTTSSGTVTNQVANSFAAPTFASTNATTITNGSTVYIGGAPTAGTNTTITNQYALDVASGLSQFGSSSVTTGTTVATFQNAGGTCNIIPSVSGGITCSSDMNLKKNITNLSDGSSWSFNSNVTPASQSILGEVLALNPVDYNWNVEQGTDPKHAGFIAQEVRQVFPDLVSQDPQTHLLSLNYTGLIPYTVEAIKEMNLNVTNIDDLTRTNTWRDAITSWFADSANGIQNFFSKKITSDEVDSETICLGKAGQQTCITKDQLDQLLQNQTQQSNPNAPMTTTVTNSDTATQSPEVDQAPVVTDDAAATQSPDSGTVSQ